MSTNPYENEPGFEEANEPSDKKNQKEYVQKVVALPDIVVLSALELTFFFPPRRSGTKPCAYPSFSDSKPTSPSEQTVPCRAP